MTKPISWRRQQLLQLARLLQDNVELFAEALSVDLGRPKQEVYLIEVGGSIQHCLLNAEKLSEWTKDHEVEVSDYQKSWKARYHHSPKGVVLIIVPWNYPVILSIQSLSSAIAAGCCAAVKLSELSPHFSTLFAELLPKYLDPAAYSVIQGAIPEMTKVLELKWDHICYTGNGRVARIIAAAAAKHLTPLTLELGGKSPVIIDPATNIDLAAKRIMWGKVNNSGQTCVAPDYVLTVSSAVPALVEAFKRQICAFFPQGALDPASTYGRLISEAHAERLKSLLNRTKGTVVIGGRSEGADGTGKHAMEPTVVIDVKDGDSLLEEELFGPILPIISVESISEAIEFINSRDHPLALYVFTDNEEIKQEVINKTTSGGVTFNDTFQQVSITALPFGGVGESGYGRQSMIHGFEDFSYKKGVVDIPKDAESFFARRYPPYTAESLDFYTTIAVKVPIPAE